MPAPQMETYRFGRMVVDGQLHTKDLIILPDRVIRDWWRKEGHRLLPEDIEDLLAAAPDVIIIGKGSYGRVSIAPETCQTVKDAGIELISQSTKRACKTYGQLRLHQRVAAAFHLTC